MGCGGSGRVCGAAGRNPPCGGGVPAEAALHVIVQYYIPEDPARREEVEACLARNVANPHVHTVHVLVERKLSGALTAAVRRAAVRRAARAGPPWRSASSSSS